MEMPPLAASQEISHRLIGGQMEAVLDSVFLRVLLDLPVAFRPARVVAARIGPEPFLTDTLSFGQLDPPGNGGSAVSPDAVQPLGLVIAHCPAQLELDIPRSQHVAPFDNGADRVALA